MGEPALLSAMPHPSGLGCSSARSLHPETRAVLEPVCAPEHAAPPGPALGRGAISHAPVQQAVGTAVAAPVITEGEPAAPSPQPFSSLLSASGRAIDGHRAPAAASLPAAGLRVRAGARIDRPRSNILRRPAPPLLPPRCPATAARRVPIGRRRPCSPGARGQSVSAAAAWPGARLRARVDAASHLTFPGAGRGRRAGGAGEGGKRAGPSWEKKVY